MIFALGCHFADIPDHEREAVAHTFFVRAKKFIGLDMLDIRTVGTVQTLLLTVLFLQSTPYPHRCWQSIGVACRLAQGLGLHEAQPDESQHPLEREIHRRTWHGCVMMDTFVSMTYGRPTMTSHLSNVPLPECPVPGPGDEHIPSIMAFYIATIELYRVLDSILSDVYETWRSRDSMTPVGSTRRNGGSSGLDVIIGLEDKLFQYESNLPSFLSWTRSSTPVLEAQKQLVLRRQRNVLHARFLFIHLLLYRPIFTQLCTGPARSDEGERRLTAHSTIYRAILRKCAAACAKAAINLISLVHDTYQGSETDLGFYNGFYTSTAGMVIIMSYACCPISEEVDTATIDASWAKCEEILRQMGSFSLSAQNTLQFLQVARARVLSTPQDPPSAAEGNTATPARQHVSSQSNQGHLAADVPPIHEPSNAFNWETTMGFLAPALYKGRPGAKLKWLLGIVAVDITMLEKLPTVCVKDWDGNEWNNRIEPVTELNNSSSRVRVIFAEEEALKDVYDAPEEFRPIARGKDINGSFFSDYTIDEDDTPTYHVSWATYKAKLVRSEHDYNWVQTTVLVKWKIPSQIEKREVTSQPSRDLARQHDIARHVFHLSEVLEVTENTLKNLVSEHRRFREEFQDLTEGKRGVIINTQQKLFFVEKEIHSQRMRARSLTERLNNEINLAFNLAAFSESAVMKTIGFVTMLYLPGTFISGIFGTNFFDFNSSFNDTWATSNKFWVYWAVTVPLTAITLILWAWWHSMPRKWVKQINYYLEKRKEDPRGERSRTDSGMTV
ncbi:hypothetical protein HFD88_010546 [Aspergillus terreus]|nr:hypothetical protein HFD88_010546 [Aspergillus terreus]